MVVSCYIRRRAGLLFCMKEISYSKLFNALLEKVVVRNNVGHPEVPQWLRSHLQEKQVKEYEQNLKHHTVIKNSFYNFGLC